MSLPDLKQALDAIPERTYCEGTHRVAERLAIMLPDGDVAAVDDASFLDWLREHSELAPFGDGNATRRDWTVRYAQRLLARDQVRIAGFDPASVLGEIEAVLSPRVHLVAQLTDVVLYPEGGRFARHKDTPRSPELVGTLVVGLPVPHAGGGFRIDDGQHPHVIDWSGPAAPMTVRWVALFSDVDHEVEPVTAGARVTLVYSLRRTDRPRADPTWEARGARLQAVLAPLARHARWPLMIACARQVITDEHTQPLTLAGLRGLDRDLAEALVAAGFQVAVRSCIAAAPADDDTPARFPDVTELYSVSRLTAPLTPTIIGALEEVVTFAEEAEADEEEDLGATSLAPYILDDIQLDQWVIRANAAATMIHEALFSESGYFGNEAYQAYLYTLAALEVTRS
ncbi:MAG: 2OG-Fe(II) oxygenase [Myxococcota bacterium]|nr:2OG-Fe(II) oxygenase [Myxococcota bacterium]